MSEERNEVKVGERVTTLSLAARLVDAVTGESPGGNPWVHIEGVAAEPVETQSGYRLFLDLDPVDGTVTVHVDAGERYQDERRDVDPSDRDSCQPLEVELLPAASYDFPAGTTLVRGHVRDPDGNGVGGVHLSIRGLDSSIETDETGEFALFFGGNDALDVDREGGEGRRKVVKVDGSDPAIEIRKSGDSDPVSSVTLDGDEYPAAEAGAVTILDIVIE